MRPFGDFSATFWRILGVILYFVKKNLLFFVKRVTFLGKNFCGMRFNYG